VRPEKFLGHDPGSLAHDTEWGLAGRVCLLTHTPSIQSWSGLDMLSGVRTNKVLG
jgi:hypothetical protein